MNIIKNEVDFNLITIIKDLRHLTREALKLFEVNPVTQKDYICRNNRFLDFILYYKGFDKVVRKLHLTVNIIKPRYYDFWHVITMWFHKVGVSLDIVRPLHCPYIMTGKQRTSTLSYGRLACGNVLNSISKICRKTKKETDKTKSLLLKSSTLWHGQDQEHLLFVPEKVISN
ncbi:hypothetical protein ACFL40_05745 [candidate division KSB1 bacterium]